MVTDSNTLRKLAEALRDEEKSREVARFTKAAHVLSAAKGLLILREKVRGSR